MRPKPLIATRTVTGVSPCQCVGGGVQIRCLVGSGLVGFVRALCCPVRSAVVGNNPTLVCVCFGVFYREIFVSYAIKTGKNPLFSVVLRCVHL